MIRRTWRYVDRAARATGDYLTRDLGHSLRVSADGEYVLRRGDITLSTPATSGDLWVTHFVAAKTETIATVATGIGAADTIAVDAQHAWVGILDWDGTQYTPNVVSEDDPTLWATAFGEYDTPLYAAAGSGLADTGQPGFDKIAGLEYAFFVLWIGTGQNPSLPAGGGWFRDSFVLPRTNGWIGTQTGPPSGALLAEWFAPDSRRFQGHLKRAA